MWCGLTAVVVSVWCAHVKDLAVSVDVSVDAWEGLGGAVEAGVGHGVVHREVHACLPGDGAHDEVPVCAGTLLCYNVHP